MTTSTLLLIFFVINNIQQKAPAIRHWHHLCYPKWIGKFPNCVLFEAESTSTITTWIICRRLFLLFFLRFRFLLSVFKSISAININDDGEKENWDNRLLFGACSRMRPRLPLLDYNSKLMIPYILAMHTCASFVKCVHAWHYPSVIVLKWPATGHRHPLSNGNVVICNRHPCSLPSSLSSVCPTES